MKKTARNTSAFALALFALLLLCILLMVLIGSSLYASLVGSAAANNRQRASLSYVAARLRAADEAGAVRVGTGPEGDLLALAEPLDGTGYETLIYLYDGSLMEEYAPAASTPDPAAATAITRTDAFSVVLTGRVAEITTGEGTARVYLHSGEAQP